MNIKTPIFYISLFVLYFPFALCAQQPLNLDFEIKSVEGIKRPWGWDLKNWGPATFTMDSLVVKNGKFSMNSVCPEMPTPGNTQSLRFIIEAFELKNKKLSLSGYIQTAALNGNASFSLGYTALDKKEGGFLEIDTTSKKSQGTNPWNKYTVDFFIPDSAQSVYVTVNHEGAGKAWFDDFKLLVNGKPIKSVEVAKPFSKENISWLNEHAAAIQHVSPDANANNDDLLYFKNAVGNSRLIALGESTHGTGEFFSLKNRLFQYAVKELGFSVFAIEDNQLAVEKVNGYVHGGSGTARESMSGLFGVWYTEEVHALIEWVRSYNDSHRNDQLSFVGFDMQEIANPVYSLSTFLKNSDTLLYKKSIAFLNDVKENGPKGYAMTDSVKLSWFNTAKQLSNDIQQQSKAWYSKSHNEDHIQLGIQYANLVRQFTEHTYKGHWSLYRDEAMAENINWLLEKRFPKNKIFLWAHDIHISRCDHPNELYNLNNSISMGSFLSKKHGSNYKSFSLSTYSGEYLALKSYTDFTRINAPLFKGPVGSLDEAMHRVTTMKKAAAVFLPLTRNETWLSAPAPKRFANHVNIDYGYWERIAIPYQFDGIFFIDKTSASHYLKK